MGLEIDTLQKWAKKFKARQNAPKGIGNQNTMTEQTEGPALDWAALRLRYEQAEETVAQIATSAGIMPKALSQRARRAGWTMRAGDRAKSESTKQTLRRLKDIIQNRLRQLEGEIGKIGEEVNALSNERDIRSANTLVRTLEKVLELEHKERKQRVKHTQEKRRMDDAGRDELARRIESLGEAGPGEDFVPPVETTGGASAAVGLAALGEGGSTPP